MICCARYFVYFGKSIKISQPKHFIDSMCHTWLKSLHVRLDFMWCWSFLVISEMLRIKETVRDSDQSYKSNHLKSSERSLNYLWKIFELWLTEVLHILPWLSLKQKLLILNFSLFSYTMFVNISWRDSAKRVRLSEII